MNAPRISGIGHISIFVDDLALQCAFYREVLGLQVTGEDTAMGIVFMSADPEREHHQIVLLRGRQVGPGTRWLQHVGLRCERMADVIEFYKRFVAAGTRIDMTIHHGNALAVYFYDPEGNLCEIYWPTGMKAEQPFAMTVDFQQPPNEILRGIEEAVCLHGKTGFVDLNALSAAARSAISN